MVMLPGLSHVAMSVAEGTLTDDFRTALLEFYGELFGWREIESQRLPDRLTILVGQQTYINVRERSEPMVCTGYEHFGIGVASREEATRLWDLLNADQRAADLAPLATLDNGLTSFRFRYLLPLAVEVQALP
jgi:hypothetical protein